MIFRSTRRRPSQSTTSQNVLTLEQRVLLTTIATAIDQRAAQIAQYQFNDSSNDPPSVFGAFRITNVDNDPGFRRWIQSYFGSQAVTALLDYDEQENIAPANDHLEVAENWLNWASGRTGLSRAELDAIEPSSFDRRYFLDYEYVPATGELEYLEPDATDSIAAMYLVVLSKYVRNGGAVNDQMHDAARDAVHALQRLQNDDGLMNAREKTEIPRLRFVLDNLEVNWGLEEGVTLFTALNDPEFLATTQRMLASHRSALREFDLGSADHYSPVIEYDRLTRQDLVQTGVDSGGTLIASQILSQIGYGTWVAGADADAILTRLEGDGHSPDDRNPDTSINQAPVAGSEWWYGLARQSGDSAKETTYRNQMLAEMDDWTHLSNSPTKTHVYLSRQTHALMAMLTTGTPSLQVTSDPIVLEEPVDTTGPTTFAIDPATGRIWNGNPDGSLLQGRGAAAWESTSGWADRTVIDINGDGLSDLIGRDLASGEWFVSVGMLDADDNYVLGRELVWGTWTGAQKDTANWRDVQFVDLDSDGNLDVLGLDTTGQLWTMLTNRNGLRFQNLEPLTVGAATAWEQFQVGRFNLDGFDDIAVRKGSDGSWELLLGSKDGTFTRHMTSATWSTASSWVDVSVGDFDQNGIDDLIARQEATGTWHLTMGSSGGFLATEADRSWTVGRTYADVEVVTDPGGPGAGRSFPYLIGRDVQSGEWLVMRVNNLSDPSKPMFEVPTAWYTWQEQAGGDLSNTRYADFNDDGQIDILTYAEDSNTWELLRSIPGNAQFQAPVTVSLFSEPVELFVAQTGEDERVADLIGLPPGTGGRPNTANVTPASASTSQPFQVRFLDPTLEGAGWGTPVRGDFNGDGQTDLLAYNRTSGVWRVLTGNASSVSGFDTASNWATFTGWQLNHLWDERATVGDVNNDGRDDLLIANERGGLFLMLANATGTGFTTPSFVQTTQPNDPTNTRPRIDSLFLLDVNGDGKDDIAVFDAQQNVWYYAAAKASGTGFWRMWRSRSWTPNVSWVDIDTGDINGDGREDIVARVGTDNRNGIFVMYAKADGSGFTTGTWAATGLPWQQALEGVALVDVTGDGTLDIVGRSLSTGQWHVMTGNGTNFDAPTIWQTWDGWKLSRDWDGFQFEDVNGDGRVDVVAQNDLGAWWVMLANSAGTGFLEETYLAKWPETIDWRHPTNA